MSDPSVNPKGTPMSGIYTSKRSLKDFPKASTWKHNGGVTAAPFEMQVATCFPTQSTTSFRTRGTDSVTGDDESAAQYRDLYSHNWALGPLSYDKGHPFDTVKQEWSLSHPYVELRSPSGGLYRGPLIPNNSTSLPLTTYFPSVPSFDSTYYGTQLFNSAVPNKPIGDMANALGELREKNGVPRVWGTILNMSSKSAFFRSLGGEYLNSVFGWTPFIKDVQKIAGAVLSADSIVEQYLSDSGKFIRRRRALPDLHTNLSYKNNVVVTTVFSGLGSGDTDLFTNGVDGRLAQVVNHDRKVWFSGSFGYYLADGIDPLSQMKLYASFARKLVGARISPEVLWELQPWSWLVDWYFNIGQILENIESFQTDGLVARYAYLMCTDVVTCDVATSRYSLRGYLGEVSRRTVVTRKQRIRASPYGFGTNPATWSPERWAILAALGLTKTPTSLR
jgi:hypothetical protein